MCVEQVLALSQFDIIITSVLVNAMPHLRMNFFMVMTEWLSEWFSNNPVFLVSIIFNCFYFSMTPARRHELSIVHLPSINFVAHCETDNWNENSHPPMIDWQISSFAERQVNVPCYLQLIDWEAK